MSNYPNDDRPLGEQYGDALKTWPRDKHGALVRPGAYDRLPGAEALVDKVYNAGLRLPALGRNGDTGEWVMAVACPDCFVVTTYRSDSLEKLGQVIDKIVANGHGTRPGTIGSDNPNLN